MNTELENDETKMRHICLIALQSIRDDQPEKIVAALNPQILVNDDPFAWFIIGMSVAGLVSIWKDPFVSITPEGEEKLAKLEEEFNLNED